MSRIKDCIGPVISGLTKAVNTLEEIASMPDCVFSYVCAEHDRIVLHCADAKTFRNIVSWMGGRREKSDWGDDVIVSGRLPNGIHMKVWCNRVVLGCTRRLVRTEIVTYPATPATDEHVVERPVYEWDCDSILEVKDE